MSDTARQARTFSDHRAFAAIWDWATRHESTAERELRRLSAARVHGRVLELGVGVGANWPLLPGDIDYVGIEPDTHMLARARKRAEDAGKTMVLHQARAEELPFADASFDSLLVTLTLCTVQEPGLALSEAWRVLRPGGAMSFFEHVRPNGRATGWLSDRITPLWRRAAGGCNPNRLTAEAISAAGFTLDSVERRRVNGLPMIAGIARKS